MSLIEDYFKERLVSLGYPKTLEIHFSLNSCQGDGVAFYGYISQITLNNLMNRLLDPNRKGISSVDRVKCLMMHPCIIPMMNFFSEFAMRDMGIQKNSYANHYSHFNTMTLSDASFEILDVSLDEKFESWSLEHEVTKEDLPEWSKIWSYFVQMLKADIVKTSKILESDGYAFLSALSSETVVTREFFTKNFVVRLSELEYDGEDFGEMDCEDMSFVKNMIDGKMRFIALGAEVLDRETKTVLGKYSYYGIPYNQGDRTYGGFAAEVVSNAISDTRALVNRLKLKVA
jgi:hypothetical protein